MSMPKWPELLARAPRLGDLMAQVRAYRGPDPEAFFWAAGGVQDRLLRIAAEADWPDGAAAYATALEVLWLALPAHHTEGAMTTMVDRETLPVAERLDLANRNLAELADELHANAERVRAGAVILSPSGQPVPAAYFDALARACAGMTLGGDEGIERAAQAIEQANAAFGKAHDRTEWPSDAHTGPQSDGGNGDGR